jgi:hypothetical protein
VKPVAHFRRIPTHACDRLPSESHHARSRDTSHRSALASGVFTSAGRAAVDPATGAAPAASAAHASFSTGGASPRLDIDASVRQGFAIPARPEYVAAKNWDYKSRSFTELSPFSFPQTTLDTVYRRKPHPSLASLQPNPYHPDHAAGHPAGSLSQYRSNYPTSSCTFSRQDVLVAPEIAARIQFRREVERHGIFAPNSTAAAVAAAAAAAGALKPPAPLVVGLTGANPMLQHLDDPVTGMGPGSGTGIVGAPHTVYAAARAKEAEIAAAAAATNAVWGSKTAAQNDSAAREAAAASTHGLMGVPRGRDPTVVPTGYRLVERTGAPSFDTVRVATLNVPLTSQALAKQYAAEMESKEQCWQQQKDRMAQLQRDNAAAAARAAVASESASAAQNADADAAAAEALLPVRSSFETADLVARHRSLPRPPPPHPMYHTTHMQYGRNADDPIAKHYVYFPKMREFTDSLALRE